MSDISSLPDDTVVAKTAEHQIIAIRAEVGQLAFLVETLFGEGRRQSLAEKPFYSRKFKELLELIDKLSDSVSSTSTTT